MYRGPLGFLYLCSEKRERIYETHEFHIIGDGPDDSGGASEPGISADRFFCDAVRHVVLFVGRASADDELLAQFPAG